jgi:glycine cleavage system aminomethyltransferase T
MKGGPLKRSGLHHLHVRNRASFVTQYGWEIPSLFGDADAERAAAMEAVALVDVSWFGKLECKGPWGTSIARHSLPGAIACSVTPERLLWIVEPSSLEKVRDMLESWRAGQPRSYLIDVSSVYATFDLVGPAFEDVLSKVSSAHVEIGRPIFAPVGGVRCLLIRTDRGLQLHFQREFAEYVWELLLDAGKEFRIRTAGVETLAMTILHALRAT